MPEASEQHAGKRLALILDGVVVTTPMLHRKLGDVVQVHGPWTTPPSAKEWRDRFAEAAGIG